jgi:hypothetical protein
MARRRFLEEVVAEAPNRRSFLRKVALAGAAGAATASISQQARAQSTSSGPSDSDILNFALNLEYLEAEFYTMATQGTTIDQLGIGITGSGNAGATTGGQRINFPAGGTFPTGAIANGIAADERAHVALIRSALTAAGVMPVAKPAINLNALGIGFNGVTDFLQVARALEDTGVTAYAGAAPLISSKSILGTAAQILATEAEHAANIRLQIATLGISTSPLDGADILPPPTGQKYFSVDNNGLVQTRTPGQVLFIAYGSQSAQTVGGFFPNGVNGSLNVSATPVPATATTTAVVLPGNTISTNQSQIILDGLNSTSASGALTYTYKIASGSLPASVVQIPGSSQAVIQLAGGYGTYLVTLTVTDASGATSSTNITITYHM